jgi:hypothetical protein
VGLVGHGDGVNGDLVAEGSEGAYGTGCAFAGVVPAVVVRSWVLVVGAVLSMCQVAVRIARSTAMMALSFRGWRRCVGTWRTGRCCAACNRGPGGARSTALHADTHFDITLGHIQTGATRMNNFH